MGDIDLAEAEADTDACKPRNNGPSEISEHPFFIKRRFGTGMSLKIAKEPSPVFRSSTYQIAGHKPPMSGSPGKMTSTSTMPPVKQNLFQLCTMPEVKLVCSAFHFLLT